MEDTLHSAILAMITTSSKHAQQRLETIGDNLAQGLGVVNTTLIQQHGGVADDSALIAALQTAAGTPRQGAIVS